MSSIPYAGLSPASAYTITGFAVQEPPAAILADEIDPITRDFTSLERSRSIADGMVIHLLSVQRGTGAAVLDTGHRLRELRQVEERTPVSTESTLREALKPAKDAGVAEFTRIAAEVDAGDRTQVNSVVVYRDLLAPPGAPLGKQTYSE